MSPQELVLEVFERVHASDPTVSDLYAEDATRTARDGRQEGRAAIARFYDSMFPTAPPYPQIDGVFATPPFVGVLLRLPEREGRVGRVLDLFEVRNGAIQSLWVCYEPPDTT
jgi:hypothetical protein